MDDEAQPPHGDAGTSGEENSADTSFIGPNADELKPLDELDRALADFDIAVDASSGPPAGEQDQRLEGGDLTGIADDDDTSPGLGRRALVNSALLTGSLLLSWILSLAGRIILPNVLGEERFGDLAFLESVAVLTMSVMAFGVDGYIGREVAVDRWLAKRIGRPLSIIQAGSGIVLVAAMTVVLFMVDGRQSALIVATFGLAQLMLQAAQISSAYLHAVHQAGAVSASTIVTKIVWFAVLLGAIGAGEELLALPLAMLVAEGIRMVWMVRAVRREFGLFDRAPMRVGRRTLRQSTPYFVNALNVTFLSYASKILLGIFATTVATGYLTMAGIAASIPMLLTPVLGWVAIPILSSLRATSVDRMWDRVGHLIDLLAVVVVAAGVFMFLISDHLIDFVFADEFAPAGPVFALLALVVPATYFTQIIGSAFIADDRSWQNTKVNLYTMLFVIIGVTVALLMTDFDDGGSARLVAAIELAGEMITVVVLVILRPFARPGWNTVARLVVLMGALGVGVFEKLGDGSSTLLLVALGATVLIALSDIPRVLTQGRAVLQQRGDAVASD